MKKKILSVALTLVLALGCAFAVMGCGSDFKNTYKFDKEISSPYSSATKVDELEGYSKLNSSGSLVVLNKIDGGNTNYKVFNLDKGAVVATIAVPDTAVGGVYVSDIVSVGKSVIFSTYKASGATETTYKLYDANGTEAASVSKATEPSTAQKLDLIKIDDVYYRVSADGSVAKAFELSELASFNINSLTAKSEKYYYSANSEGVFVYSAKTGELVSFYQKPDYAESFGWYVLSNGNIFAQYVIEESDYTEEYDFLSGNDKYTLVQIIINPKNGDVKDVKNSKNLVWVDEVDVRAGVMYNIAPKDEYLGSVENFAKGLKIENKRMSSSLVNFELSDSGSLSEIEDTIVAQDGVGDILDNGYVIISNKLGQKFLYNKKGKLVGEVTNKLDARCTNKYITTAKAIYDYDLKKVIDLEASLSKDGYSFVSVVGENIVLQKKNADEVIEYFVLKDGAPVLVAKDSEIDNFSTSGKCINITKSGKYYIYNEEGTALLSDLESSSTLVANSGDNMLRKVGTSFYYFK